MKVKKLLRSSISWVIYILILVALIYGIPRGMSYLLDTPYPMAAITSGSMWPALKKGDMVLIKGIDGKEDIKEGDIIVYRNPKGFTIHRVIKINTNTVTTKGDANNVSDPPVKYEEIIGKTLSFKQKPIRIPVLGNIGILINRNKS